MAKKTKFDGVIETVRYAPNGTIDWVRAYERRGATFSDWVLISRQELIVKIKAGKLYVAGKRVPYMASTFEVNQQPIQVVNRDGGEFLVSGDSAHTNSDRLDGVPII
jgi:hypothetical protein